MMDSVDISLISYLAAELQHREDEVDHEFTNASRNVRTVLQRQHINTVKPTAGFPVCRLIGESKLLNALSTLPLGVALFTLARVYDEAHLTLCRILRDVHAGSLQRQAFANDPCVDLHLLTNQLGRYVDLPEIVLEPSSNGILHYNAVWRPIVPLCFDKVPRLSSLSDLLPGERSDCHEYAGIGGGGGSDVISASLLGQLLQRYGKQMNLLISTRTWAIGSQGRSGSALGTKREVYNHGGPAIEAHGRPIPGTFLIKENTYAEGRDLETIPLPHHSQIFMVLDQGESLSDISIPDRADLKDQFEAVLGQSPSRIDSVLIIDTGGDVFGANATGGTTPGQDLRVQKALSTLSSKYSLVTAVVAPGVDAPDDAPDKALKAGGMIYTPTEEEKSALLDILVREYRMDGSDPSRFGKTTLALQAALKGAVGWTSLDLPTHVVDTWENPWSSFVYVRKCMNDIIFIPTTRLVPLIE